VESDEKRQYNSLPVARTMKNPIVRSCRHGQEHFQSH